MPEQSDNTNPYIVQPCCTDTALDPDGVLQTDKGPRWKMPSFLQRSAKIAPRPENKWISPTPSPLGSGVKLNSALKKRNIQLHPPTNRRLDLKLMAEPSWGTFQDLQNKYWTSHDCSQAMEIYKRYGQSIYLCYIFRDNTIYECLYGLNPLDKVKYITSGNARDINKVNDPNQRILEVPFDSENVIWCTHARRATERTII